MGRISRQGKGFAISGTRSSVIGVCFRVQTINAAATTPPPCHGRLFILQLFRRLEELE